MKQQVISYLLRQGVHGSKDADNVFTSSFGLTFKINNESLECLFNDNQLFKVSLSMNLAVIQHLIDNSIEWSMS